MKLILFALAIPMWAQAILTPNLPASITAGSTFTATVTQSGSDNIAGYQFTITLPSGISLTACTSLVGSKSAACPPIPSGGLTGAVTVFLAGMNQTAIPAGPSLSLTLKASNLLIGTSGVFALSNTLATTPNAQTVKTTGGSATVPFVVSASPSQACVLASSTKTGTGSYILGINCK